MILKRLIGRRSIMENETQKNDVSQMRKNILIRIKNLERSNYAQKPDGLSDMEMIERIKKIIEQEVDKCL